MSQVGRVKRLEAEAVKVVEPEREPEPVVLTWPEDELTREQKEAEYKRVIERWKAKGSPSDYAAGGVVLLWPDGSEARPM